MPKNKKYVSNELIIVFFLGVLAAFLFISASSYSRPYYGMMGMTYRGSDCGLTDDQMRDLGENMMDRMIGDPVLHEQMDRQMLDERTMHIMMAKMMTGCR